MNSRRKLFPIAVGAGLLVLSVGILRAALSFEYVQLDNTYFAYERDVGDIDGDGNDDIVGVQEGQTTIQAFHAPDWNRSTLFSFSGTYRYPRADDFKLADIDGDGDLDLVTTLGNSAGSDSGGPGRLV